MVIHYHRAADTLPPYVLRNLLIGTGWSETDLRRLKLVRQVLLARGTLVVAPFGAGDPTGAAYYLCRPSDRPPRAVARRLERWLWALAAFT